MVDPKKPTDDETQSDQPVVVEETPATSDAAGKITDTEGNVIEAPERPTPSPNDPSASDDSSAGDPGGDERAGRTRRDQRRENAESRI